MQLIIGDISCNISECTITYGTSYNGKRVIYYHAISSEENMSQESFISLEKSISANFNGTVIIKNNLVSDTYTDVKDPKVVKRYGENCITVTIEFSKPME